MLHISICSTYLNMKGSFNPSVNLVFCYILMHSVLMSGAVIATDTILPSERISVGNTLLSAGQVFELGFFSPGKSRRQYVGIWYNSVSERRVVWVANRDSPLSVTDKSASLVIANDGNLRILDGKSNTFWSTNISAPSNNTFAMLTDGGDLVLHQNFTGNVLWESFDHPCDVFLASTVIGMNTKTGEKRFLTSWTSEDDPSSGEFTVGLLPQPPVQFFIWKGSAKYWRSGPWNGSKFVGMTSTSSKYEDNFVLQQNSQVGTLYIACSRYNISYYSLMVITREGSLQIMRKENNEPWGVKWKVPNGPCDVYGVCGLFGICNANQSPICTCPKGFVPKSKEEWHKGNWTSGCMRRTELQCKQNIIGSLSSAAGKKDGFWKLNGIKLPDNYEYLNNVEDDQGCQRWCLNNCTCNAYAHVSGINCLVWTGNLIDVHEFSSYGHDLYIRLAFSELDGNKKRVKLIISLTTVAAMIILAIVFSMRKQIFKKSGDKMKTSGVIPSNMILDNQLKQVDAPLFQAIDFNEITVATNGLSEENKIGQGGFGAVFKGRLEDGQEIAVKKLSSCSGQGIEELKNEIQLISKLQHRNLVRIVGFCIEREEKLIVYEYMENKSLDTFIFAIFEYIRGMDSGCINCQSCPLAFLICFGDATKRALLDWPKRFNIILGVARGLLYLHRESRLRVIHRDLKASNILLDNSMAPKISDFGMARAFSETQDLESTHHILGTFGYMAPEYAMKGIFSEKSDVYSFGVLLLELVTGRNSCKFYDDQDTNLLGYAWWLWNEGKELQLIDMTLLSTYSAEEVQRCVHIGLLCVQEHPDDRPTMSIVVVMLSGDLLLPEPKQPSCFSQSPSGNASSINEMTVSVYEGR